MISARSSPGWFSGRHATNFQNWQPRIPAAAISAFRLFLVISDAKLSACKRSCPIVQHSGTFTASPPRDVSRYLSCISAPV
jgi:hypothetical protein